MISRDNLDLMMQQVPVLVPVAAECLKAPEFFTLFGRKPGNEYPALETIVDDVRRESDCEAGGKTAEETCPEHKVFRSAS